MDVKFRCLSELGGSSASRDDPDYGILVIKDFPFLGELPIYQRRLVLIVFGECNEVVRNVDPMLLDEA